MSQVPEPESEQEQAQQICADKRKPYGSGQ